MQRLLYDSRPDLDAARLSEALDEFWRHLGADDGLRDRVSRLGVDPDELAGTPRESVVAVEQEGAGFDLTALAIVLAPVVTKVSADLWDRIILPWLVHKFGPDALRERDEDRK